MPEEFSELQTLLRLKRHETPPPGYLEDFLGEFHRRQRAELLRRPLWRIALDRMGNLVPVFPALPVPNLAYAGASAVALVAAAGLLTSRPPAALPGGAVAQAAIPASAAGGPVTTVRPAPPGFTSPLATVGISPEMDDVPAFGAANDLPVFVAPPSGRAGAATTVVASDRPRYLLDTRPVRYELRATSF